ncbi:adsorption protein B [Sphingomonas vulcanisoli]|uniref:Adsorption protein B n=1 Tax=Sphingomonas vulcanisoli TaxID=1658060 RepID=A0ABX0TZ45_9SPHN|nr:glycosyl transferase family protein [Sphingomonas vulcanisoli]NIJ09484.1 adsorption protein B [Sphingomonas vulcanisoli]
MGADFAWLLGAATREIVLFAAVGMLLGAIDDLAIDLIWLGRGGWRRLFVFSRHARAAMATLPPPDAPGAIAVFIPAWRESAVIGAMLRAALARFDHGDYRLYVGTYPNDPATAQAVTAIGDPRIRLVRGLRPGPTSKGECLNRLWRAMLADEQASGRAFKAIVLHDAEDVVHPMELRLYDRMIERFDLIQIPVLPLPALDRRLAARTIAATYADEFSEGHGRQLIVREALGAAMPSAGVGCAIRREMLARVAAATDDRPFPEDSLTEDYELGLRIAEHGGRGVFVSIPARAGIDPVAVRAHFPETFHTACRQKARWVTGIALAGWDRLRWRGGLAERWMRFRDRRAPLAALILACGYFGAVLDFGCWALGVDPHHAALLRPLLHANLVLLGWRLAQRVIIVERFYGPWAACLSVPRIVVANLIAIVSVWRAIAGYQPGRAAAWDKTEHFFPESLPCD